MKKNSTDLTRREKNQLVRITSQLGKQSKKIISEFAVRHNLKIILLNFLVDKNHSKCCFNKLIVMLYQKRNFEMGRMRVCCAEKLDKEILRVVSQLSKPKKTEAEIYQSSYNAIRGSIGHIIFQSLLGINESKYIRESEHIKERSILRTVNYWVAPCSPEQLDNAITEFQKEPSEEKIREIICLYSPLYKEDKKMVNKMSSEIVSYLANLPQDWKKQEAKVVPTHVGIVDIVIGKKIIDFKFTEQKLGCQKEHFRQLYRYYRSALKLNPRIKKEIKSLCVFSPITGEKKELTIKEVEEKWDLERNFETDFMLWQLDSVSRAIKTENSLIEGRVKGPNVEKARLEISQRRKLLEVKQTIKNEKQVSNRQKETRKTKNSF